MSMTFTAEVNGGELISGPNFSNSNMRMVARALGLPMASDEYCFAHSPEVLEAAIAVFDIAPTISDTGMPTLTSEGQQGATMIECGVRPGYFAMACDEIGKFCREARSKGAEEVYAV